MLDCRAVTESGGKLILTTATACCAWVLLSIPRPVVPAELPSLMLDRSSSAASMKQDAALALKVPSGPAVAELRTFFRAQGVAETAETEVPQEFTVRHIRSGRVARQVQREHGPEALDALRSEAAIQFQEAFGSQNAPEAIMGAFPDILAEQGAVLDGTRVAPLLCLRALYKARWNGAMRRPLTEGLSEIENRAYWGWLALHGVGYPLSVRTDALERYASYGGQGSEEAAGIFALWRGATEQAASMLEKEHQRTGRLRVRNFALGTLRSR